MAAWDPSQYLKFAGLRARPAVDLLQRVPLEAPAAVYDLGCGPGNVTRMLAARWPAARVSGVDSSPEMLRRAAEEEGRIAWVKADLAGWRPEEPADLLFSNAALHWLDDHAGLFPALMAALKPGGVLAVQMPRNHQAPSHRLMIEAAEAGPWRDRLRPLLRPSPVAEPAVYYDILAPLSDWLDIWETEYLQPLTGEDAVVEWTKGTALKPLLDALDESERETFLAAYAAGIRRAYPTRADGVTLFPFRRIFIVAGRKGG